MRSRRRTSMWSATAPRSSGRICRALASSASTRKEGTDMGSIYYPKYRNAAGEVVEQGVLWLKYRDALGVVRRQSSGTSNEAEARRQLKRLEGAAVEGEVIAPRADKGPARELADDLVAEYAANARRSAERLTFSLAHLLPALGHQKAVSLTSAQVTAYSLQRQQAGAANATINRELAALKR